MEWTHAICDKCWEKLRPQQEPARVGMIGLEPCCFCGNGTIAGIYVQWNPADRMLKCKGEHGEAIYVEV